MDLSANEAFLLCKRSFEEGWVRVEGDGEGDTRTEEKGVKDLSPVLLPLYLEQRQLLRLALLLSSSFPAPPPSSRVCAPASSTHETFWSFWR